MHVGGDLVRGVPHVVDGSLARCTRSVGRLKVSSVLSQDLLGGGRVRVVLAAYDIASSGDTVAPRFASSPWRDSCGV